MVTSTELVLGLRNEASYGERVTAALVATLVFLRGQGGENQEFADEVGPELIAEYDSRRVAYDALEDRITKEGTVETAGDRELPTPVKDQIGALSAFFIKCSALVKDNPRYEDLMRELTPEVVTIIRSSINALR